MSYYAVAALINFATSVLLGVVVLVRNYRNKVNYSFALFSLSVGLWSLCYFLWQVSEVQSDALFWSKALMAFAIFIPPFYSHFVFALLGLLDKKKTFFLIFTYLLFGSFLLADIFSPYFVVEVKTLLNFQFWPIAGPAFNIFLTVWIVYVIYNTYLLYKGQKRSTGLQRSQIKYVFWGLAVGFIGGTTNYFLWYEIPILPFGNILVSAYVALTAIAIIRHRLLDIQLIFARTMVYLVVIAIVALLYVAVAFFAGSFFLGFAVSREQLIPYVILTILLSLSFGKLRMLVEKITDSFLFKGGYDSSSLLTKLGNIMSTNIELSSLTRQILATLTNEMRVTRGSFVLLDQNSIYTILSVGFSIQPNYLYQQLFPFLKQQQIVLLDDIEEGGLKQAMRFFNLSVSKILQVEGKVIGLLLLGEKASGEIYSEKDLKILDILAPEVAIAIQNARSFEQIKRFNITLSEEVKRATSDLQQANNRLQVLDKLKDDFVSVASHELRTPMTAIRSYSWMALNRPDVPLSDKMKKYLGRVLISTERLINLVNDMLNVSRIEAGRIEVRPKVFDIQKLADDVMVDITPKASEKMIKVEVIKSQIPQVFADPDKVHEILLNLIGNSLKFTPVEGTITVSFFTDGNMVDILVKDSGTGITKEDLSRLFQKFGRLDNSYIAAATSGGTGLGLFISKSLVNLMGGKIWASSEGLGRGATFTFSLPIASAEVLANAQKFTKMPIGDAKPLEPVAI